MSEWSKEYIKLKQDIKLLNEQELRELATKFESLTDITTIRKYNLVTRELNKRFPSKELKLMLEQWRLEELEDEKNEEDYGSCEHFNG